MRPLPDDVEFSWYSPGLGDGIAPEDVYAGYRIFVQRKDQDPAMLPDLLLDAGETDGTVPAASLGAYERIGLAAEDASLKDAEGKPLLSPIAWLVPREGEVTGTVMKPNPASRGPFSDAPMAVPAGEGISVVCEYWHQGVHGRQEAITDAGGRFYCGKVPLDVPVELRCDAEKQTVTCTAANPRQDVTLGGVRIREVSTADPDAPPPPPPPED